MIGVTDGWSRLRGIARVAAGIVAAAGFGVLFLYPPVVGRPVSAIDHAVLPFLMLAACGAIVDLFRYRPRRTWMRTLIHPAVTLPLMITGWFMVLTY